MSELLDHIHGTEVSVYRMAAFERDEALRLGCLFDKLIRLAREQESGGVVVEIHKITGRGSGLPNRAEVEIEAPDEWWASLALPGRRLFRLTRIPDGAA